MHLALREYLIHRLGACRADGARGLAARLARVVQLAAFGEAVLAALVVGHRFGLRGRVFGDVLHNGVGHTLSLRGTLGHQPCGWRFMCCGVKLICSMNCNAIVIMWSPYQMFSQLNFYTKNKFNASPRLHLSAIAAES